MDTKQLGKRLVIAALSFYLILALIPLALIIILPVAFKFTAWISMFYIGSMIIILAFIFKRLLVEKRDNFDINLSEQDAPEVYELIDKLKQRLNITKPISVILRIGETWIPFNGLLNKRGKIHIRLSNNDLAVLSIDELKVLITIQLVHAVHVEKGIDGFIYNSIERINNLLKTMSKHNVNILKQYMENKLNYTVMYYLEYRKPLEEHADSIAIQMYGENLYNSMTLKNHIAHFIENNTSETEHYQQVNNGVNYWEWLRLRLAPVDKYAEETIREWFLYSSVTSAYYAYQVLSDRIRIALTDNSILDYSDTPAYRLLADNESIILRMFQKAEEIISKKEKRNSKEILKSNLNVHGYGANSTARVFGLALLIISLIFTLFAIVALISDMISQSGAAFGSVFMGISMQIFTGIGYLFYKIGTREYVQIPIPSIDLWLKNVSVKSYDESNHDTHKIKNKSNKKSKLDYYRNMSYGALMKCEYSQVLTSSRIVFTNEPRDIEAITRYTIAKSHYDNEGIEYNLNKIYQDSIYGPSFRWAMAWIGLNIGNLDFAEINLLELILFKPVNPKIYAYLGYVQYHKGKLYEAEANFLKAMSMGSDTVVCRMFYADTLRSLGRAKEAIDLLAELHVRGDEEKWIGFRLINAYNSIGDIQKADEIADRIIHEYPENDTYISIADAYQNARVFEKAEHCYKKAYEDNETPKALIGLARLERDRYRYNESKEYLYQAIGLLNDHESDAMEKLADLNHILSELLAITKPIEDCGVWTVDCCTGDGTISPNQKITVSAMNQNDAEKHIKFILSKLYPQIENLEPEFSNWNQIENSRQLRAPGVQNWQMNKQEPDELHHL